MYFPKRTSMISAIPLALLTVLGWHSQLGRLLWLFPPLEYSGKDASCLLRAGHKRPHSCHVVYQHTRTGALSCHVRSLMAQWAKMWKSPNQPPQTDCMEKPWDKRKGKRGLHRLQVLHIPLHCPNFRPHLDATMWETLSQRTQPSSSCRNHEQNQNDFHCFKSLNFGVMCLLYDHN